MSGQMRGEGYRTYLRLAKQAEQLPSFDKVHDHVQILRVLKGPPQGDEKRVLDSLQHPSLVICVLDLLHLHDLRLLQHLDGIEAVVVLGLDQVHSAKAACPQRALQGKVF